MTKAELLGRISSRELEEWRVLYRLEDAERVAEAEQAPESPRVQQPDVTFPSLA